MSQRLLLHISDASRERRIDSFDRAVTLTQNLDSARDVSRAIRSQFEQKSSTGFNLTVPEFDITTVDDNSRSEPVDVQVRIEHTVKLEHVLPRRYELEDYSRSGRSARDIPRH
ncbi:hypothetical protein BD779DRAFT_962031 [Infundibulicybe gibba]|nr:hypothetical protein BD779DRAFT_962031 [Infundibulicybe gibba]